MTIATPERYREMLESARRNGYAYPAINVTSTQTLNAALQGFAEAQSDGIIQVSVGGASYFSGQRVNDRVTGSLAFAAFAHEVAAKYPNISIALHTDHCAKPYLDGWVRPLLAHEAVEVAHGREPAFQSHMWDGSTVPLKENLDIAEDLLDLCAKARTVLEIEVGAVGGEEDGHRADIDEKLYSTPADGIEVARRLGLGERGTYMAAFTFGNVHGAYKPGVVKLRPELLGEIQREVASAAKTGKLYSDTNRGLNSSVTEVSEGRDALGFDKSDDSDSRVVAPLTASPSVSTPGYTDTDLHDDKPFMLVFHGGSGSSKGDITAAVHYGVVKMNIDTDTQYAFTRAVAGHMFEHYDSVLKVDGEVGEKRYYDPRSWGRTAEDAMAKRVVEACVELGSAGKALK
ncbi:class II fructose-bisphosphate aldolase [Bifidobacterium sp. ESL0784]|uniref:class II fructose-bisphosphate aldolase n=1 Tax=Bifidobacterium sp. ESL0784 TaxID=2983231 RepID=UPI0023F77D39|nr:class II fructose-bisphosphate aldolase [Bifidobacterium sp. ESL0784]MDF7640733.1 class II fructose-bisphosphate aldolase [Bifidobacterium sp. ESL0784]